MLQFINVYWRICLLRMAPQELPTSSFLLALSLLFYGSSSLALNVMSISPGPAALAAVIDTGILVLLTRILLWVRELGPRYTQTATALAGCGGLLGWMAAPLVALQHQVPEGGLVVLVGVAILALIVWNLVVVAHILRHALNAPFVVGGGIALMYMYVALSILRILFEPTT